MNKLLKETHNHMLAKYNASIIKRHTLVNANLKAMFEKDAVSRDFS